MSHRTVLISRETTLVLFVAIQQENGVIHRNTQLQYRRQRFCNVTDLTKENVTSQIIYNRCTYTDQEKNRDQEGLDVYKRQRYSTCIFPELRSICHFFQMSFAMSMGVFLF